MEQVADQVAEVDEVLVRARPSVVAVERQPCVRAAQRDLLSDRVHVSSLVVGAGIRSRSGSRALHVEAEVSPVDPRPTSEVAC